MRKIVGLTDKKGFTIIEVVLVLAIAGLIFLIVFLAVPALQRSRRDTQRRADLGRMMAQLEQFAANSNGNYPNFNDSAVKASFISEYMDDFSDPSSGPYVITVTSTVPTTEGSISINGLVHCDPAGGKMVSGAQDGTRDIAALVKLESGGAYCLDNS